MMAPLLCNLTDVQQSLNELDDAEDLNEVKRSALTNDVRKVHHERQHP